MGVGPHVLCTEDDSEVMLVSPRQQSKINHHRVGSKHRWRTAANLAAEVCYSVNHDDDLADLRVRLHSAMCCRDISKREDLIDDRLELTARQAFGDERLGIG